MIRILNIQEDMKLTLDTGFTFVFISMVFSEIPYWVGLVSGFLMIIYWVARVKLMIENRFDSSLIKFIKHFFTVKKKKKNDNTR